VIRRLVLSVLVTVVVLLLAAAGALYWFLSGDAIRQALEAQATSWLGEPVHIGTARAQLFPRIGIDLTGVRIGEPARLEFAVVTVSTPVRPLLSRRIEGAEITIARSRVDMPLPFAIPSFDGGDTSRRAGGGLRLVSVRSIALRDVVLASRGRTITVNADSSLAGSQLTLQRFTASSGRTDLEASGVVTLEPRVDARLQAHATRLDLDDLVALANSFTPAAPASSGTRLPVRISAHLSAATATIAGVQAQDVAADLALDGDRVTLSPLSFRLFGGRFDGAINAALGSGLSASVRARVAGIDAAQLAAFGGVPQAITGTLAGNGTFSGTGRDFAGVLRAARGSGALAIVSGTVQHLDLVRTVILFFGRPQPGAAPGSDRFDRLDARFSLARQVLSADALSLHSADADIAGQGTLNIATKELDGGFTLSLSEALSQQAGTDLFKYAHEGNRIVLPAKLGGTAGSPRLTIDAAAAVQRGLTNELRRRLGDIFDRLKSGQP